MRICTITTMEIVGLVLAATLVHVPLAYPAGQPVTDYEISLHELGKVKKSPPAKKKPKEHIKRKKTEATSQKSSPFIIHTPSSKKNSAAAPEPSPRFQNASERTPEKKSPMAAVPAALTDKPRISHDPYSYLVAGKQTVLLAVISSAAEIKSVFCKFRGEEKGEDVTVSMTKVDGTQYTYRAILPALTPNVRTLRYRLVAVDTLGRETQSRDFSTDVKISSVIPGWQLEDSPEALPGNQAVPEKRIEKAPAPVPVK